ncbi:MAG: LptE family protein [Bacteroidales bacterium]|jgi:outer membrane lipopolysaccharide assembly protein LptE/RlpB|nr:LptE family protein [Bacteroidales bacterium]
MKRKLRITLLLAATFATIAGCGIYSFSGTSIQPDVKTICIEPVVNKATKVNPSLANQLTEELNDKFRKLTKLEQVTEEGDLNLLVTIESYDVRAAAVTANEVAALNRLTVTCKVKFTNVLHPEDDLEQSFAGYEDYDSNNTLDMVEGTLCETIVKKLVDDIFNATVAQW